MKGYGQFCPLAQSTQLLCERWTLLVVRELIAGSTRFNELRRGVPLMSPTLLSQRLKRLEKAGVLERKKTQEGSVYELTLAGQELRPVVELLGAWGHRWARSSLDADDLDAGLLMWDMRRTVDAQQFPERRIVIQFRYFDAPKGARDWWLISQNSEIELCLHDPGHEVDVFIESSLETMTAVWICEIQFQDAVRTGDIKVKGDPKLTSKLQGWLCGSPLARLGTFKEPGQVSWKEASHAAE
jgi:DNA-binding HxlR family transcriptional regulator